MDPMIEKVLSILFWILATITTVGYILNYFGTYPNRFWLWFGFGAIGITILKRLMRLM